MRCPTSQAPASRLVDAALADAPPGSSAGWILPLEPMLDVERDPGRVETPAGAFRTRAA